MKKNAAVVLACMAVFCLCACGSGRDPNLGKYLGTTINILGTDEPMSGLYAGENSIELKSGGKAVFIIEDEPMNMTYDIKEGVITLTSLDNLKTTGTIGDGVIKLDDFFGVAMGMTFEKNTSK